MKFKSMLFLGFLGGLFLLSCGSKTEQNTAQNQDTTTTQDFQTEEKTPEQTTIKKPQTIRDYYELLKPNFQSLYDSSLSPKIVQEDLKNGYLKAVVGDGAMGEPIIAMGLWKTVDKQDIIGVFTYSSGGEGDWATLDSLKFYDSQLNEIREEVLDWNALTEKKKNFVLKHSFKNGEVSFQAEQTSVFVNIPEKGTNIDISIGVPGIITNPFVTLIFDKQTGTFKIQDAK